MRNIPLFESTGAHVLVDGQYGSTGKGVLAAWLALKAVEEDVTFSCVVSNAGPNSGHTFYHGDEKHVLKQLPTFSVAQYLLRDKDYAPNVILSAGAIIDPIQLAVEAEKYPGIDIYVHPNAAVITAEDRAAEHSGTIAAVAGTRSGTGAALARKVQRDPKAVVGGARLPVQMTSQPNIKIAAVDFDTYNERVFVEVSQGFSLGINQTFYPKVTSRECTVAQAIADAGIPPRHVTKTYLSLRTYPIRVGNVDGYDSGEWYPDQWETTWEALGVEPELTTVTQRVRRVATWSDEQFLDACRANDPDIVFLNFLNYLPEGDHRLGCVDHVADLRDNVNRWFDIYGSVGPKSGDVSYYG